MNIYEDISNNVREDVELQSEIVELVRNIALKTMSIEEIREGSLTDLVEKACEEIKNVVEEALEQCPPTMSIDEVLKQVFLFTDEDLSK